MTKQTAVVKAREVVNPAALPKAKRRKNSTRLTKKAQLVNLLNQESGTNVATISKRFGWLPHTTRAALTRLRQAGYEISSEKTGQGKVSRYRITGAPVEQNAR